jgi:hypothetical protein
MMATPVIGLETRVRLHRRGARDIRVPEPARVDQLAIAHDGDRAARDGVLPHQSGDVLIVGRHRRHSGTGDRNLGRRHRGRDARRIATAGG